MPRRNPSGYLDPRQAAARAVEAGFPGIHHARPVQNVPLDDKRRAKTERWQRRKAGEGKHTARRNAGRQSKARLQDALEVDAPYAPPNRTPAPAKGRRKPKLRGPNTVADRVNPHVRHTRSRSLPNMGASTRTGPLPRLGVVNPDPRVDRVPLARPSTGLPNTGARPSLHGNGMQGISDYGRNAASVKARQAGRMIMRNKGRSGLIAAGALTAMGVARNTGRGLDRTIGRPTGMFGY